MLIGEFAPRRSDWGFVTDLPEWATASRETRAALIAVEWLTVYEGESVGPLDRQPIERWLEAFLAAGYIEVDVTVEEEQPGQFQQRLDVYVDRDPRPAPDLWRTALPANARRWSWTDSPSAVTSHDRRERGERIFRCRQPFMTFAVIHMRFDLRPDTKFWSAQGEPEALWSTDHSWNEWIVAPGEDVREMRVLDLGDPVNWYLAPGRVV